MMEWSCDAAMPIPMTIPVTTKRTASRYERDEAFTLMILSHVHGGAKTGCAEAPSRPRRYADDEIGKSRRSRKELSLSANISVNGSFCKIISRFVARRLHRYRLGVVNYEGASWAGDRSSARGGLTVPGSSSRSGGSSNPSGLRPERAGPV